MKCTPVRITVQAGEDQFAVYWRHVRASLGEGCCPRCGCRLEPIDTPLGVGGMCRHCDHAWAMREGDTKQWRLHSPHDGSPLPLT